MKIGIVGSEGIVGSTLLFGFSKLGQDVVGHDLKLNTKIDDLLETEVIYICVPTAMNEDGSCDTKIVESVIDELFAKKYQGIKCIKSTVEPGTTQRLIEKYDSSICNNIEFLRERHATADFVENHKLLAVGTTDNKIFDVIVNCHGSYPLHKMMMTPTECELLKYYHNFFGALRVVVANEFFEICHALGANYTAVKNGLLKSASLPDQYLDVHNCNSGVLIRGFSSICYNKDIPALYALIKRLGLDLPLITTVQPANDKFVKTPFANTRESY